MAAAAAAHRLLLEPHRPPLFGHQQCLRFGDAQVRGRQPGFEPLLTERGCLQRAVQLQYL